MKHSPRTSSRCAFTLIEILVVISIISVLSTVGLYSYQASLRSARDSRRLADVEILRSALELYRNTNNVYPATLDIGCTSTTGITDGTTVYLPKNPRDPKCPTTTYYYTQLSSGADYTLGALFESTASTTSTCGSCASAVCNYCVGPLGGK